MPRASAAESKRKEIWAVDCETDPFKKRRIPRPFIWGAYNGIEYHEFSNADDLVHFFYDRPCLVYAHNGGRFDWHYLLGYLEAYSDVLIIAGRLAKFKIGEAEYRDSWNLLPMPLKAGGAKFEIDYSILELENRDVPSNRVLIRERLRTDCLYLFQMLERFISEFGLHLTFPTASMAAWAKLAKVEKPETNSEFYETIAPYYFGGRVECFESGIIERPLKMFDINSAYSYAMLSQHPYGETIYEQTTLPDSKAAIERSFITLRADACGSLPFRADGMGLEFPNDGESRLFNVTGWEFLASLETGSLRRYRVDRVLRLPTAIDFSGYMDHFYRMKVEAKEQGDVARYEFAKRFLCSLYGKFGSNPDEYQEYKLIPPRYIDAAEESEGYLYCADLGKFALCARPLSEAKKRFYNVAVAASITGYVRAYLYRAIKNAKGVVYCDTDCIVASDFPGVATDPTKLGSWKHEADIDFAAVAGKKLYAFRTTAGKWKTASKGVKLSAEEIVRIARGEVVEFEPEVPQYSMKRGIHFVPRKIRKTA